MTRGGAFGALLALGMLATVPGCVTATVQEVREGSTGISADESIVVLGRKHKTRGETETGFVDCVSRAVAGGRDFGVMSETDFVDATFPWFEPRTAPLDVDDFSEVVGHPLVSERIREIGVRYLVWIEGTTQRTSETGTVNCTMVSGGIPACFGFLSWENDSNYEASVWDVRQGVNVGRVRSEAVGTSFIPALVVPIPIVARVRQGACNSLSDQLRSFLSDEAET
ncbi:MAG: hypothetical protein F4X99_15015 [Gammaproteobacteria bacterium]|nr:hypothetical protein [Gammaproteobacteria bacterium]